MALYVTADELRSVLGVGTLYSDADLEGACETATTLIQKQLWFDSYPVVGGTLQSGIATVVISAPISFTVGESVTIHDCGNKFNGTHTITATYPWSQGSGTFPLFTYYFPYGYYNFPRNYSLIQWVDNAHSDQNYRLFQPYGRAIGADTLETAYADEQPVRQAALMVAVDVWQARQAPSSGGVSVDGITPSPWRMSNSLLGKVRGLLAPYTSPRSMLG